MKNLLNYTIVLLVFFSANAKSQEWMDFIPDEKKNNPSFFDVKAAFEEFSKFKYPSEISGIKQYKRWEVYMQGRVNAEGRFPTNVYWNEYQRVTAQRKKLDSKEVNWQPVGPFNIPEYAGYGIRVGVGRIDCIAFHPTDEDIMWIGTPAGGAWKTVDGGLSWQPMTDHFPTMGVADIIFHPNNPNIMYMATGERDAWNTYSMGVLKSTDGGDNWESTGLDFTIQDLHSVDKLLINPDNPNIIIAGTNHGIYKTIDGAENWQLVSNSDHFRDLVFKPFDNNVIYAATYNYFGGARIYKSIDGGDTFETLNNTGMPYSSVCRIKLGVSMGNPEVLYALNCHASTNGLEGFYRSMDGGESWTKTLSGSQQDIVGYSADGANQGGQGFYNLSMAVSPYNANEVLVGGTHIWRSTDGGDSFSLNDNCYQISVDWIHADLHEFVYNPISMNLFAGCDGGIYKSLDNGENWIDISEGLQITQSYRLGISQLDPDLMMIGNQDNASFVFNDDDCWGVIGGDGMECMIDHENTNIIYGSIQGGVLFKSLNGGNSFFEITPNNPGQGVWTTPFFIHPTNSNILYACYNRIFKSEDKGVSWEPITDYFANGAPLHRVVVAPANDQVIYAATYNTIWKTENGGANWEVISEDLPVFSYPPIPFDLLTFYDMKVSFTDPETLWVTYSNFAEGNKVFKTIDGGDSWINISGNLPNFPVNCIVQYNNADDGVYVGTDIGVYYTDNNLDMWFDVSNGLPNVIVTDMEINYPANKLVAATHGRGVWETELFDPTTSVNKYRISDEMEIHPNPATSQVIISFKMNQASDITISVRDVQGCIVMLKFIETKPGQNKLVLDISKLAPGIYFVDLKGATRTNKTKKLIKS